MKSVGETMAIGRTFKEALQKGLRGLEIGHIGLDNKLDYRKVLIEKINQRLKEPNASRIFYIKYALQKGLTVKRIARLTHIDPWFLENIKEIVDFEIRLKKEYLRNKVLHEESLRKAKELGFSDSQIAFLIASDEMSVRNLRKRKKSRRHSNW